MKRCWRLRCDDRVLMADMCAKGGHHFVALLNIISHNYQFYSCLSLTIITYIAIYLKSNGVKSHPKLKYQIARSKRIPHVYTYTIAHKFSSPYKGCITPSTWKRNIRDVIKQNESELATIFRYSQQ